MNYFSTKIGQKRCISCMITYQLKKKPFQDKPCSENRKVNVYISKASIYKVLIRSYFFQKNNYKYQTN